MRMNSCAIVFVLFGLVLMNRFWTAWGPSYNNSDMLKWDVFGYYAYIPATIIYNDPGIENNAWLDSLYDNYKPSDTRYQFAKGESGKTTIRYPIGMALQWSPFVLAGHFLAESFGYPADGLSAPYSWSVLIGGLFYAFIGLWFLRKVLLSFFSESITIITMALITMGTNYWAQIASDTIMPHSNLFTITTVVFWFTIKWHETPRYKYAIGLGLALGLATISRPTEIIWILVPLLWNVKGLQSLKLKLRLLWTNRNHIVLFVLSLSVMLFLQLSYWKFTTGNWIYYSYDAYFTFTDPFIAESLFSYKKGWLLYTPLMIFAIAGFVVMYRRKPEFFTALFAFFIINCWVIMSWECWWYAHSFSNRALVEMYPAMAVALGFMITYMSEIRRIIAKVLLFAASGLLALLNLFQVWQYNHGLLDGERITKAFYWQMFLRTEISGLDKNLLEPEHWLPDETISDFSELRLVRSDNFGFEDAGTLKIKGADTIAPHSGRYIQRLGSNNEFSLRYEKYYDELTDKDFIRVRTSVWIRFDSSFAGKEPPMIVFDFGANQRTRKYLTYHADTADVETGTWFEFHADYIPPLRLHSFDQLATYIWNPARLPMSIDDFKVEVYELR